MDTAKPVVFISHASDDKEIVNALDELIRDAFHTDFEIFNSSNESISPGESWRDKIFVKLKSANAVLVVYTPQSVNRAWVNFEAGGAWVLENKKDYVIPCGVGLNVGKLPSVISHLNGLDLSFREDIGKLIDRLASLNETSPHKRVEQFIDEFAGKVDLYLKKIESTENNIQMQNPVTTDQVDINIRDYIDTLRIDILSAIKKTDDKLSSIQQSITPVDVMSEDVPTTESVSDSRIREIQIIRQLLEMDHDKLQETHKHKYEAYLQLYEFSEVLSYYEAMTDNELIQLADVVEIGEDIKKYSIRPLRYMLTKQIYKKYKPEFELLDTERYDPFWFVVDGMNYTNFMKEITEEFIPWIKAEYFPSAKTVRLPTIDEWIAFSSPPANAEKWNFDEHISRSNVKINTDENRKVTGVGIFKGGISRYGCADVIGNVWELCLLDQASTEVKIAGWSYQDVYRANWEQWTRKSNRAIDGADGFPVGFRLVIID